MAQVFTHGRWVVRPGREDDFIAAWQEMADWTGREVEGAEWARLLRDEDEPNVFFSFGPWESRDAVKTWRRLDGFQDRVGRIGELLENFEAHNCQLVGELR
jgi:heme-degrading monooxygenase HmoA